MTKTHINIITYYGNHIDNNNFKIKSWVNNKHNNNNNISTNNNINKIMIDKKKKRLLRKKVSQHILKRKTHVRHIKNLD